jgi:hypothetical protein
MELTNNCYINDTNIHIQNSVDDQVTIKDNEYDAQIYMVNKTEKQYSMKIFTDKAKVLAPEGEDTLRANTVR